MLSQIITYNQTSVRLEIEGLPDPSIVSTEDSIGIISKWKLYLIGFPELEGNREHLNEFISVILIYARNCLSGVSRTFSSNTNLVTISPHSEGHKIKLTSTKIDVDALEILIDDSELADLVRVFDDLRLDKRVIINWNIKIDKPLKTTDLIGLTPLSKRFYPPLIGLVSLILTSSLFLSLPIPEQSDNNRNQISNLDLD